MGHGDQGISTGSRRGLNATHNVAGVNTQGAEKRLVTMGTSPLVPEAECLVDVQQLPPHVGPQRSAEGHTAHWLVKYIAGLK